ncbi:hypothetical protein B0H17DRAFT_1193744 [Mycena rosella]|uniref:Uncharacterized protein n=1 Tax=Mycena rosella TaxID=1033263 RepID=A0AAD7GSZ2_MYCRO|nr:hypothetical protein B0H17DRAFT_1193744 [Mycena rosella]
MTEPPQNNSRGKIVPLLEFHENLHRNAQASSSKIQPTLGMMTRASLSRAQAELLQALSKTTVPPVLCPRRRRPAAAATNATTAPAILGVFWKHEKPVYVFLNPAVNGVVWLTQDNNKMALGAPGIGIEHTAELERFLVVPGEVGEWTEVDWETRMRVKPDESLLFRFKGVKRLQAWDSTTRNLII